ncbi:MAG: transcriptional repressor [Rubritalea sp.]|uniref:Fur family transcriptional regulator n=1 Tax=Rubritalea sp. TaxID=2109375 RepID=UPI003241D7FC
MSTPADTLNIPGLRMTKQRKDVYRVLTESRDHPTASEVYDRVKHSTPGISLATIYNCLETLVEHKAVKQVNFDRESSRYCPNLSEHGHFHDEKTGVIHDINFKKGVQLSDFLDIPENADISSLEITLRGTLPKT